MELNSFKRDNHYVPRSYLKRWAPADGKLWVYRLLVSHPRVPIWKSASPKGVAHREHLYTRIAAVGESDELERWLDSEFESPAEEAIEKAVSDRRLTPRDWRRLARFFAAQDVRTPARLVENLERWSDQVPKMIEDVLHSSLNRIEKLHAIERLGATNWTNEEHIPFRFTIERNANGDGGWLKGEGVAGRGLWTWSIRNLLTGSAALRALEEHRWTILTPPDDQTWFTTDDPVLKLNFNSLREYDFGGGWGSRGTDLMLPLGPRHLLYAQVGKRGPPRGSQMDADRAQLVKRFTAEHAHRHIYSMTLDPLISSLRPRVVDAAALRHESDQWNRWHAEQSDAERALMGWEARIDSA